jgi:N-acetylglucosaminyldiphosphoundecaprenol N-acetyl-beta-D-mannosaminyltransferase
LTERLDSAGFMTTRRRICFGDLQFDDLTMAEIIAEIDRVVRSRRPHRIFTINVACYIWSRKSEFLRSFYQSCELLTVDGMGLFYGARLLGLPFRGTVAASYLMFELLKICVEKRYRIFLLGGASEVVERAVVNLKSQYPKLLLVGHSHGYFSDDNEQEIVRQIRDADPDILFIAMASPRKEEFAHRNWERTGVPVQIGVGGSIEILAGVRRFPPRWVRILGLEWLGRLIQEPRRLWKRYLFTNAAFACSMAQLLSEKYLLARRTRAD